MGRRIYQRDLGSIPKTASRGAPTKYQQREAERRHCTRWKSVVIQAIQHILRRQLTKDTRTNIHSRRS